MSFVAERLGEAGELVGVQVEVLPDPEVAERLGQAAELVVGQVPGCSWILGILVSYPRYHRKLNIRILDKILQSNYK